MTAFDVMCYAVAAYIGWVIVAPIAILLTILGIAVGYIVIGHLVDKYKDWKRRK